MSNVRLENVNIESVVLLATPREMRNAVPQTSASLATVVRGRETIEHILDNEDPRLLAIVGPCSIQHRSRARICPPPQGAERRDLRRRLRPHASLL